MEEAEEIMRSGITREGIIGKIFSAVILSGFILYVLPLWEPSLFGLVVMILSIYIISDGLGRYFAGRDDWTALIPAALAVAADVVLFVYVVPAAG